MEALILRPLLIVLVFFIFPGAVSAGVAARDWQLDGGTPLMNAAHAGNAEVVRDLLNRGANPNERSKDSHATPLIFAAAAGRVEVVKLLLARGADPNLCAWGDTCPIWWATTSGSIETMKYLLDAGADVSRQPSPDTLESPSLKIAAASGRVDIAKVLLDHGIDVDYTNFFRSTQRWHRQYLTATRTWRSC